MCSLPASLQRVEDFFKLFGPGVRSDIKTTTLRSWSVPERFILKDVVIAAVEFLRAVFKTYTKIDFRVACKDEVSIIGAKDQLHDVLCGTIAEVQKSFQNGVGMINVAMHDLNRKSDVVPGEAYRNKYVAVTVRKSGENLRDFTGGEVSYYDGGVIVRIGVTAAVIYLLKSEA